MLHDVGRKYKASLNSSQHHPIPYNTAFKRGQHVASTNVEPTCWLHLNRHLRLFRNPVILQWKMRDMCTEKQFYESGRARIYKRLPSCIARWFTWKTKVAREFRREQFENFKMQPVPLAPPKLFQQIRLFLGSMWCHIFKRGNTVKCLLYMLALY